MGAKPAVIPEPQAARIMVNLFDGTRQPMPSSSDVLITARDGWQNQTQYNVKGSSIDLEGVKVYGNSGDNYAILGYVDGYEQSGFYPIIVSPQVHQIVDLMLLPNNGQFNFAQARWTDVQAKKPKLAQVLEASVADPTDFYDSLIENEPAPLACLLNITTAMDQIFLAHGTPLDYLRQIVTDDLRQDRFFAYCSQELKQEVAQAVQHNEFEQESSADLLLHNDPTYGPATSSFKQIQFGEANVQLTFHEGNTKEIGGETCILVEPDIDYYKDLAAHTLLEVIPNAFGGLTDPKMVYVLRWIAGQHAGIPNFDPLYTIQ